MGDCKGLAFDDMDGGWGIVGSQGLNDMGGELEIVGDLGLDDMDGR